MKKILISVSLVVLAVFIGGAVLYWREFVPRREGKSCFVRAEKNGIVREVIARGIEQRGNPADPLAIQFQRMRQQCELNNTFKEDNPNIEDDSVEEYSYWCAESEEYVIERWLGLGLGEYYRYAQNPCE